MAEQASNVVLNFMTNGQVQYAQTLKQINMVMQTAAKEYTNQIAAMGRDADMTEKLRAEKQKLTTQMAASSEKVRMLNEEFEEMQNSTDATAEELQALYNKLLAAENAHTKLEQSMKRVNEGLTDEAIAAREAGAALKELQSDGKSLEAEQRRLISAFELEEAQLGANATETQRLELAQRRLAEQTNLAERAVGNLEDQLDQARTAYGDNSDEVMRLETRLNEARTTLHRFGGDLKNVEDESGEAEKSIERLGGAFRALGGLVAGLGLAGIIQQSLDEADIDSKIDITFNVPEESKETVRSTLANVKKYGVDAEEALEGMRRQWALNKDATDEMNASVVEGSAVISRLFAGIDFIELVQEVNEVAKELNTTNDEALNLVYNLLDIGFPTEQLDIISEYGQQLQRAGYEARQIQGILAAAVNTGTWNIDNLLDGLKEGRIKAVEFGEGLSESIKDSLRKVVGNTEAASEEQLKAMEEGFSKQESALSKSLDVRMKTLSKSHESQKNALSKTLDAEYKAVSKNYNRREKALEKSLSDSYDKAAKQYDEQQKALEKSLDAEFKAVSKNLEEQQKVLEKSLSENYDQTVKKYEEQQKALEKSLELEVSAFEKASQQKMKLIDAEFNERLKLVDEERYNQIKALDSQIDALDARTAAEDRAIKQRENAEKRAELKSKVANAKTNEERQSAAKSLRDFEEKLRLDGIREERKRKIDSIKEQKEVVKETFDARKDSLKQEVDVRKEAMKEQIDFEKESLKELQAAQKDASKQQIKDNLSALSEANKAEVDAFKETATAKKEALKESHDAQKEATKQQAQANLAIIKEANKAEMDAFKEASSTKLEALKEEQNQRKQALNERLSDEMNATKEAHQAELESFKKMNSEKMELAKNPPDSAAVKALFDQLEGWGKVIAKGGEEGTKAFEDMVKWLDSIEDATLRNALGVEMFGVKWEDQGENIIDTILNADDALSEMEKSQRNLNDAIDATDRNPLVEISGAYESIKKSLSPLLIVIADVVGAFASFAAEHPKLTSAFVAIAAVVGILVGAFALLAPAIAAIPALIPVITVAFAAVGGVVATVTAALPVVGAAIAALAAPIGIAIAAIALIVGAIIGVIAIIKNWGAITDWLSEKWSQFTEWIKKLFDGLVDFFKKWGTKAFNAIAKPVENVVKFVSEKWDWIKKKTKDVFESLVDLISKPINKAKDAVAKAIDAIKKLFNFEFKWPKLKMPKFEIEGTMNPMKWFDEGLPKIDVKWNAKGGIFTQPTIFGASGGRLQGAGEAGPEAVIPLNDETLGKIGRGIASTMSLNNNGNPIDINLTVELDGAVIAKKTAKYTSRELYAMQQNKNRGGGRG